MAKKRARVAELEELFKKPTWQRLAIWLSYQGVKNVTGASPERRRGSASCPPHADAGIPSFSQLLDHLMGSVYDHV